jgi:hypothetical protein
MAWKTLVGCLAIGTLLSGCTPPPIEQRSVYMLCATYVFQKATLAEPAAAELKRRGVSPSECIVITAG